VQYRLLGPLEVVDGTRVVEIGSGRRRSLLALLLINAGQVVSAERLIDELWGEAPPATATKTLQVRISELRKVLAGPDRPAGAAPLLTRANGYVLEVEQDEVDSLRFARAVDDARHRLAAGDPRAALVVLDAALSEWRGRPLAGLEYEPFAQDEIARLEELRLIAHETRADAALELGEHVALVPELEPLVQANPLRERFRAQLMLALYRSGRQADALAAYRHARTVFAEELGLEPSEELRRLERAILEHDAALEPFAAAAAAPGPGRSAVAPERAVLIATETLDVLGPLLALANPLAAAPPAREVVITAVVEPSRLAAATTVLAGRRDELIRQGVSARSAAFSSPSPGEDIARMAGEPSTDLVLLAVGPAPLEGYAGPVLRDAPPDVALVVEAGGPLRDGPVVVPFGAAWHDWAALELGAWAARGTGAPLRLIGAASEQGSASRDASRLLADASLIVQRQAGVLAEPLLGTPGHEGVMALARGAGLLVVALSDRWAEDGLGRIRSAIAAEPPAPTVLVRRGTRAEGLQPGQPRTRFGWSLTPRPR